MGPGLELPFQIGETQQLLFPDVATEQDSAVQNHPIEEVLVGHGDVNARLWVVDFRSGRASPATHHQYGRSTPESIRRLSKKDVIL